MRRLIDYLFTPLLLAGAVAEEQLQPCGSAFYRSSQYTCYDEGMLCPVTNGQKTLRCGDACYLPSMYSCVHDQLIYPPVSRASAASTATDTVPSSQPSKTCPSAATRFQLNDPPYSNYFYSDCHSASQVVVTSPLDDSNLTIIGPRLLIAWPAGNSGAVAFFAPQNGVNGTLSISLVNSTTTDHTLEPIYTESQSGGSPVVGVSGYLRLNSSAALTNPILGSVRTIRDFVEGPSLLEPVIQDGLQYDGIDGRGAAISRLWLDNVTTTTLSFAPIDDSGEVSINNKTLEFEAGLYMFNASFNYPQLTQLEEKEVLNNQSQSLIRQSPDQAQSLAFLSYETKLLAGAWRFLTYFGRDSMIFMLLSGSILSTGSGSALEAGITAVLDRINQTDGSACHEETIGDYATYLNMQQNLSSTVPQYDYKMIDTDLYLPILMVNYFVKSEVGKPRRDQVLDVAAAATDPFNKGLTYRQLAQRNAERIMNETFAFAQPGGQTKENLVRLKPDQIVGEWRDSTYGIGGGRIPYDVNTALVPAALRAIADLAAEGFYPDHPDWKETADKSARIWEDGTLQFFEVNVAESQAKDLVQSYVQDNHLPFPAEITNIDTAISYHALALDGNNDQSLVKVMNTDDCFRHFLLNTTNQTQLSSFISQTADHILAPFPVGLSTDVGLLVANPAYGGDPVYAANFSNSAYHGTVVWSWQLAMMGAGLERQLDRCVGGNAAPPDFCGDSRLHGKVLRAYSHLWDLIEANTASLSSEVWSWTYRNGRFVVTPLGELPPPPGSSPTESDIRQLWSLTFLAVKRNKSFK